MPGSNNSSRSKTRSMPSTRRGRSTTRQRRPSPAQSRSPSPPVGQDDAEDSSEGDNRKRKAHVTLTEALRNKRKRKGDGRLPCSDLTHFKNAARRFSCTWSPFIDWSRVFNTGLERDEVIDEGCKNVALDDPERSRVLELYDKLIEAVPDAVALLEEAVSNESLDELVTQMTIAASGSISNDIRDLKERILDWAKQSLDIETFDPPLLEDGKKSNRGWRHPQIGRLLCTPVKLAEFDKNPENFCARVREHSVRINHKHFPSCFYSDGGLKASTDSKFVCHNLLIGSILFKAWVNIFLGEHTADMYIANDGTFRVSKKGKAYQYDIHRITYRTIAYASLLVRHSLSASSDWRTDDRAVVKRSAFDAVVALFEDPKFMQDFWNDGLLKYWNSELGWMLPSADEPDGLESDDDEDSSLNMISALVLEQKRQADQSSPPPPSSSCMPLGNDQDTGPRQPVSSSSDDVSGNDLDQGV
ncbi:hypothetical protein K435DRAFT_864201 [Dendrothele bispora CBS 962.96]|uniref:Uncharacterized protein n=1 Tax=Dendrothele bispora (strain CBS 962.96) TaxID=1314807 RepID=A0A4S8LN78_DENBC|nr:hypothetical protein K435DRAFT_864201 [Dendrothele bispora CBS 962.96]